MKALFCCCLEKRIEEGTNQRPLKHSVHAKGQIKCHTKLVPENDRKVNLGGTLLVDFLLGSWRWWPLLPLLQEEDDKAFAHHEYCSCINHFLVSRVIANVNSHC